MFTEKPVCEAYNNSIYSYQKWKQAKCPSKAEWINYGTSTQWNTTHCIPLASQPDDENENPPED